MYYVITTTKLVTSLGDKVIASSSKSNTVKCTTRSQAVDTVNNLVATYADKASDVSEYSCTRIWNDDYLICLTSNVRKATFFTTVHLEII